MLTKRIQGDSLDAAFHIVHGGLKLSEWGSTILFLDDVEK
jgi:hypothetical protein